METSWMRGFSNTFIPDGKLDVQDSVQTQLPALQYVETGELERTWKTARRQRLKQQEERIWSEFVQEQDIVNTVCHEDPYQFLEQLPESQLKDLMETELERMKLEAIALEESKVFEKRGAGDTPRQDNQLTVTFSEVEQDDEVFRIFDEDREDQLSGIEEDMAVDSPGSPCTVRERDGESARKDEDSPHSEPATARKSSENVPIVSVIESSIYCAKVKDLRSKINGALIDNMTCIENVNVACMDPQLLRKMCRRAAEFTSRFQRIHLYQIQRQVHDIKRHNSMSLPFAKHTQFQSQMVRIVSLHQYVLQALQVFHKSVEQTACLRESAEQLRTLCAAIRDSVSVCAACVPPHDFTATAALYHDDILTSCEKLESTVTSYVERVSDIVDAAENTPTSHSKKSHKGKERKKKLGSLSKSTCKNNSKIDATMRLSMYSLERLPHHQRKGSTSKEHGKIDKASARKQEKEEKSPKSHRKSPKCRRPLMRAPSSGTQRRRAPDADIQTMVEAVEPPSSHISREPSPQRRRPTLPRANLPSITPRTLSKRQSLYIKPALTNIQNENLNTGISPTRIPLSPNSKVQFIVKHTPVPKLEGLKITQKSPRNLSSGEKTGNLNVKYGNEAVKSGDETVINGNEAAQSYNETAKSGNERVKSGNGSNDGMENSPRTPNSGRVTTSNNRRGDKEKSRASDADPAGCEVTRLLRQLCGGDSNGARSERNSGAKNAQLLYVNGSSPRQPSTPQLLRILEETIQKKVPKSLYHKSKPKDAEKLRLTFNIPQNTADNLFQYRTKFVQHMLTSSMYANSAVGKPWEMVSSISERIIDEILLKCANEMELQSIIDELYKSETQ